MFSEEEREELIRDGLNESRREDFRKGKEVGPVPIVSLDAYMRFLSGVQKTFAAFDPAYKEPKTRFNRL